MSMNKLSSYIERISQEEHADATVTVELETNPEIKAVPEALTDTVDEMIDIEPAADTVEAQLEEVVQIQDSLEHYALLLGDAQKRGGLRPEEAAMYRVAIEHFQSRLGVVNEVLSAEDFGGNLSRSEATRVSTESLKATVKEAAKKTWAYLQELFKKLLALVNDGLAKTKRLTPFFQKSAADVKTKFKDAVKTNKFTVSLPAELASFSASQMGSIPKTLANVALSSVKDVATAEKILADAVRVVKAAATQGEDIRPAILEVNTFAKLPDSKLVFHPFFEASFVGSAKITVKNRFYNDTGVDVTIGLDQYTRAVTDTVGLNKTVIEVTERSLDLQVKMERHLDDLKKFIDGVDEEAQVNKLRTILTELSMFMIKVCEWCSLIHQCEVAFARVIRQVQRQLEPEHVGETTAA